MISALIKLIQIKIAGTISLMNKVIRLLKSRAFHIFCSLLLGSMYILFIYAHFSGFLKTHEITLLLFALSESLLVFFYVFRSQPNTISVDFYDWLIAIVGTFAPLFFRPTEWGVLPMARYVIIVGAAFQMMSILSLNRSFALVAANRIIKTQWMYRFVRHPLYASYGIIFFGYILSNTSVENGIIYSVSMILLYLRIIREEKLLVLDPLYRQYQLKVPYRLIPFVI
jgi:protein-S-isoprenylcysteine O-methyltransferase Ste14